MFTCSFCGIDQDHANLLVAGPNVIICDSCVFLAVELVYKHLVKEKKKAESTQRMKVTLLRKQIFKEIWGGM